MRGKACCVFVFLFFILFPALCFSEEKVKIEPKISGVVFTNYEYVLSDSHVDGTKAGNFNSFDVSRVRLNVDAKLSEKARGFLQMDTNMVSKDPWSGKEVKNEPHIKQSLLEMKDIYPGANLMFGLILNPWRGYENSVWRHRFVSKISDDIDNLFTETDRGVGLHAKTSNQNIEYDTLIINGEGMKGNETNKYKDFILKLSYAPGPQGLKLHFYGHKGNYDAGQEKNRLFGGFSYERDTFNVMGTYKSAKDKGIKSHGFSIHGMYNLSDKTWVFGRFDRWDPDKNTADDGSERFIVGYGYKLVEGVKAAIDFQGLHRQKKTATKTNKSALFYHLEIKF